MNNYRNDNDMKGQHTPVQGEAYAVSASWRIADGLKATKKFNISLTNHTYRDWETDRKSTRLNSSHITRSRMPSSA